VNSVVSFIHLERCFSSSLSSLKKFFLQLNLPSFFSFFLHRCTKSFSHSYLSLFPIYYLTTHQHTLHTKLFISPSHDGCMHIFSQYKTQEQPPPTPSIPTIFFFTPPPTLATRLSGNGSAICTEDHRTLVFLPWVQGLGRASEMYVFCGFGEGIMIRSTSTYATYTIPHDRSLTITHPSCITPPCITVLHRTTSPLRTINIISLSWKSFSCAFL
jgi:hypothetical protein